MYYYYYNFLYISFTSLIAKAIIHLAEYNTSLRSYTIFFLSCTLITVNIGNLFDNNTTLIHYLSSHFVCGKQPLCNPFWRVKNTK